MTSNDALILALFIAMHAAGALFYFGGMRFASRRKAAKLAAFGQWLEVTREADDAQ